MYGSSDLLHWRTRLGDLHSDRQNETSLQNVDAKG
jgi:hypothetical protein